MKKYCVNQVKDPDSDAQVTSLYTAYLAIFLIQHFHIINHTTIIDIVQ